MFSYMAMVQQSKPEVNSDSLYYLFLRPYSSLYKCPNNVILGKRFISEPLLFILLHSGKVPVFFDFQDLDPFEEDGKINLYNVSQIGFVCFLTIRFNLYIFDKNVANVTLHYILSGSASF